MKNLINISNKVENLNEVFSPIKSVKLKNFPLENKKAKIIKENVQNSHIIVKI